MGGFKGGKGPVWSSAVASVGEERGGAEPAAGEGPDGVGITDEADRADEISA